MADFPNDFHIRKCRMIDNDPVTTSDTNSLFFRRNKIPAQRFEFKLISTILEHGEVKAISAELGAINRDNSKIEMAMPVWSDSDVVSTTVSAPVGVGQHTIPVASTSGMKVGEFFRPDSQGKCYQVSKLLNGTSMECRPKLIAALSTNDVLTFNGCEFRVQTDGDPLQWEFDGDNFSGTSLEIKMVEVWS
jgi:hypothetical protein